MVKTTSSRAAIVCCLSLTGAVLCGAPSAQARVTQVVITATESPTFGGRSFGARRTLTCFRLAPHALIIPLHH